MEFYEVDASFDSIKSNWAIIRDIGLILAGIVFKYRELIYTSCKMKMRLNLK